MLLVRRVHFATQLVRSQPKRLLESEVAPVVVLVSLLASRHANSGFGFHCPTFGRAKGLQGIIRKIRGDFELSDELQGRDAAGISAGARLHTVQELKMKAGLW